jgi:DNA-binding MarR family transcriptional regulator
MPSASGNKRRAKKVRSARSIKSAKRGKAVDYDTLARFRYELRRFQAFSEAAANRSGLTAQQHQALLAIRGFSSREPISVGDLARYLLIRHHTAVELVDRMVKLKILSRSVDPRDARRVLVQLTREGERRLQRLSRIHLEELRAIGPTLTKILKLFGRP